MKSTFCVLIAVSCYFGAANSKANAQNIISELETSKEGEGTIHIVCDPKITELLGTPAVISNPGESAPAQGNENPAARAVGYRIQIYMDNSQKAKNEVIRIESLFNETFPDVWTYVTYNAPNWKVLAGDFRTREEAAAFQQTIQHFLPELGKEMYVVPSKINLSIQR